MFETIVRRRGAAATGPEVVASRRWPEVGPVRLDARPLFAACVGDPALGPGARLARRGAWSAVAAVFQTALVGGVTLAAASLPRAAPDPVVEVAIVRAPPRPRPYAPAAPAAAFARARRPAGAAGPRPPTVRPPPPAAIFQPREIAEVMKADASEPVEEVAWDGGEEGVVGGIPFETQERSAPAAPAPAGDGVEDAPQYATGGFRRPSEVTAGCVRSSVRVPPDLVGFVSASIVVKFAVGRDGRVGLVQLLGDVPDPRIFEAIRQALVGCRWRPGADARGQPVTLWVVLPIRFAAG